MYIDTRTKESMEKFICEKYDLSVDELQMFFNKVWNSDNSDTDSLLLEFIRSREIIIDEILFFHLSRRLNSDEGNNASNNLYDLLLQDTSISAFLREYGLVFKMGDKHLELYNRGKIETFGCVYDGNVSNVKWRMGYFKGLEDFCVNGFALRDLIFKNTYARELYWGPEFIYQLLQVIGRKDILEAYIVFCNPKMQKVAE